MVVGLVAGFIAAGSGLLGGVCCLLQFANALLPMIAGLFGGGIAAAVASWHELPGEGAGAGIGLGLRGGGGAAVVTAVVGLLLSLLFPLFGQILAISQAPDVAQALITAVLGLAFTALWAAMFWFGGAIVGVLLAIAIGAVVGAAFGQPAQG